MEIIRPTWAEIKLSSLKENIFRIRRKIPKKTKLLFVVKANAYGHGAVEISKYVEKNRLADFLGVSSIEEGIELRENSIKIPIIILGSIYPPKYFKYLTEYDLTPTISSLMILKELEKFLLKNSSKIKIHIKLETGMNRIGASESSVIKMIENISSSKNIFLEGIYSHFSSADTDRTYTMNQFKRFKDFISNIRYHIPLKHIANSYATILYPQTHMDMVRCGIAGYGYVKGFNEILTLKTKVVFLKYIKKGSYVSYSQTFKAKKKTRIATLPVGYGDGYLRSLSNKAYVMIKKQLAPVIGNITMDMTMVDVSNIKDINIGDEVTVFGGGIKDISIIETAQKANTIPYEITTLITKRVKRIYI